MCRKVIGLKRESRFHAELPEDQHLDQVTERADAGMPDPDGLAGCAVY
jgi:hypothetical protein